MRQNKGAALQGAELSELWQALGKVYRDDQFDFYSQIIAFCALLQQQSMSIRGHTVGEREEQQSSKDRDCADHCLSRLQFLATPCPLHCQLPHTADRWKPSMEQQLQWRQEQYHEAAAHHHQHRQQLQKEQQMKHQQTDNFSPPPSPPRHAYPPAAAAAAAAAVAISSVAQPNTNFPPTGARSNSHTPSSGSNVNSNKLVNSHQAPIVQRLNRPQFSSDTELHIQAQQGRTSRDQGQSRPTVHFVDTSKVLAIQDQQRASYSRLLKESEQQRELEQLLQGNGVVQRSRSESLEDLSGQAERHLQHASRSEHVSERYEQLLQQHQHQHRNKQHQHQQQHQSQHKLGPVGWVELVAPPATIAFTGMTTHTTQINAALPTEKEVMSKHLPPQQEEPELSNNHNNNNNNRDLLNMVHSAYAYGTAQKSTEFHMHTVDGFQATVCADGSSRDDSGTLRGHDQQHQQESLEFSAEVVAFIQRGLLSPQQQQQQQQLQSSERNGEDSLEEDRNEEDPSSAGCKELQARWLLAGEAVRAHLTSSAQAQDLQKLRATMQTDMARTAALKAELAELSSSSGSSMEVLRGQINKTFDRLNLMERSNLIAHAQYRSVLASLGSFREQALAVADAGVQHLSVQAEEVRSVRKDALFGTVCLQVHQKSMGRIEVSSVVVTIEIVVILRRSCYYYSCAPFLPYLQHCCLSIVPSHFA